MMIHALFSSFSSCILSTWLLLLVSLRATEAQTIWDLIVDTEEVSTLELAIETAGLVDLLDSPGSLTVFGPWNPAFDDLAAAAPELVTALISDPGFILHLQDVLAFHVVGDLAIASTDIPAGVTTLTMVNGETTEVTNTNGVITIGPALGGTATVVEPDGEATNGFAHAIDAVLLPSFVSTTLVDVAASLPDFTTLVDLLVATGLTDELNDVFGATVRVPMWMFILSSCVLSPIFTTSLTCSLHRFLRPPTMPLADWILRLSST